MELAGGRDLRAVSNAIDDDAALTADSLTAIRIKGDRFFAAGEKVLVEDVEHLQEGRALGDSLHLVLVHRATVVGTVLAPDLQCEVHL